MFKIMKSWPSHIPKKRFKSILVHVMNEFTTLYTATHYLESPAMPMVFVFLWAMTIQSKIKNSKIKCFLTFDIFMALNEMIKGPIVLRDREEYVVVEYPKTGPPHTQWHLGGDKHSTVGCQTCSQFKSRAWLVDGTKV